MDFLYRDGPGTYLEMKGGWKSRLRSYTKIIENTL